MVTRVGYWLCLISKEKVERDLKTERLFKPAQQVQKGAQRDTRRLSWTKKNIRE